MMKRLTRMQRLVAYGSLVLVALSGAMLLLVVVAYLSAPGAGHRAEWKAAEAPVVRPVNP